MVLRIATMLLVILIAAFFSSVSHAQDLPACNIGKGHWVLSTGHVQCRKCPKPEEHLPGKALKLPFGCMSPLAGALLDIDDYEDLKASRKYALELENWKMNLGPTLDNLNTAVEKARGNLEISLREKDLLLQTLVESQLKNQALETQMKTVIITSSVGAALLAIPLIILATN